MTTHSMSSIRAALVAVFAMVPVSNALHAQAQTVLAKATVPFAFQAGDAHFAPGAYTLSRLTDDVLSIRGSSHSASAMIRHNDAHKPSTVSQLVFRKYNNRYFLREVWIEGNPDHLITPKSKAERQAEHVEQASNHKVISERTDVEIALLANPR